MQVVPSTSLLAQTATTSGNAQSTAPASATTLPTKTLGINDFMTLLAKQFEEQDPLQPMDDTAFIAQTAQFTALQQTSTLTQSMTQMAAANYIGSQVQVNNTSGQTITGVVTGVDTTGTTPNLIVGGAEYPLTNLLSITSPQVAAATAPAATTPATTPSTTTTSPTN